MNICVYGASSDAIDPRFLAAGEALGREMARRGHGLIFGGGGHGLMGAVARGMTQGGGSITGIAPRFFNVDGVLYDGCTEFLYTETMRERKALMESKADAFVMTPGGIGTYEEFYRKALKFMNGLSELFEKSRLDAHVVGIGPLFQVWFSKHKIKNYRDAAQYADGDLFRLWWEEMLVRGQLFHPHYFENMFISMVHTDRDIENSLQAAEDSIKALEKRLGKV